MTFSIITRDEEFVAQQSEYIDCLSSDIYNTLAAILPPPNPFEEQIYDSLRLIVAAAADFSVEMCTQPCGYAMKWPPMTELEATRERLPPNLCTERPANQCLISQSLNDTPNAQDTASRMILFPLVFRMGDEAGYGDEESVIFPAQVLALSGD